MSTRTYPKLKDSGIQWLGQVPQHWEVKRLKRCVYLSNEKVDQVESGQNYVGLENVESGTGRRFSSGEPTTAEGACNCFSVGDVLFGKLRPYSQ